MAGADGAFFILAVRSYLEHHMRRHFPQFDDSWTITFSTNLYNYKRYLIEKNPGKHLVELSSFKGLMDMSSLVEDIYRDFATVSAEEVRAVTFNFLQFCRVAGIEDESLSRLKKNLSQWENRKSISEDLAELERVKEELSRLKRENDLLLEQYRELEELKTVKKYLESRLENLSREVEGEKKVREELAEKLKDVRGKLPAYDHVDRYLKNLLRVSLYSRTRMDYERNMTSLTEEQKDVLKSISLKNDFLVKGGAGTGKTLVLLEAMKQANDGVLAFASKKLLLLTYTNTLVKYDRYISGIMNMGEGEAEISTADRFLNRIFEEQYPNLAIDYTIVSRLCGKSEQDIFSDVKHLVLELEEFLWGYGITREEYIDRMIRRKGLKERLSAEQREKIWTIKEDLEKNMLKEGKISRAYSRLLLLEKKADSGFDHIFVDESQDLYPVELRLLKNLSSSSVILAGDTDQSIYGMGAPYSRAGITTPARTKILRTNFRNSLPIHNLAERFRSLVDESYDGSISPRAFREGPVPELYLSDDTEELYNMLVDKVRIFVNTIEYDRENISILAPGGRFLEKIAAKLKEEGIDSVNIKDPDFDFHNRGSIRLSPLHSSKGIDMPVVMLFIPVLFYNRELESGESEKLLRNLIYVSMTRAMENLNIFTKKSTDDPVISDLIELMEN